MPKRCACTLVLALSMLTVSACEKVSVQPEGPHARGTIVLSAPVGVDQAGLDALVATQVQLLTHQSTLDRALVRLGMAEGAEPSRAKLDPKRRITARRIGESLLVEVVVTGEDSARAARLCNGLLEAWLEAGLEARLSESREPVAWLSERIQELEERMKRVPADDVAAQSRLQTTLSTLIQRRTELELEARLAGPMARILERCQPYQAPKS